MFNKNKKNKKYALIKQGIMEVRVPGYKDTKLFRLKALRDIPEHGVKAGDLGGYVSNDYTLSHGGSCWIADNAQVIQDVKVRENAYVGGNAVVVNPSPHCIILLEGNCRIYDNAKVYIASSKDYISPEIGMAIRGNSKIYEDAIVISCGVISNNAKIHGNAVLNKTFHVGEDSEITDNVKVGALARITGKTILTGDVIIDDNVHLRDCIIGGKQHITANMSLSGKELSGEGVVDSLSSVTKGLETKALEASPVSDQRLKALAIYQETLDGIASYETDIVKIIKYPVMTDRTDPFTRNMAKTLKTVQRLAGNPDSNEFNEAVLALEDAYLAAESNALKIAGTNLSELEVKKTKLAKEILNKASDEASTESEKKIAFIQGFKQLEGVIVVPETAIETFRIKIGLKELEV